MQRHVREQKAGIIEIKYLSTASLSKTMAVEALEAPVDRIMIHDDGYTATPQKDGRFLTVTISKAMDA